MTIDKFRIMHSTIIEHYQYIEHHLEGIYASICGKEFIIGLDDVEKCSINRLIQEIRRIEEEKQITIFSDWDYKKLEYIRLRRNFWCHNCFIDMVFDGNNSAPKKKEDVKLLIDDMKEAEVLRDILFQKKLELFSKM